MGKGKVAFNIFISAEDLRYKPRHKLKATKHHKDKKKYDRKVKHEKKHDGRDYSE